MGINGLPRTGLPAHLALTPGEAHDNRLCSALLSALLPQTMLLVDRGYYADCCIARATWSNGSSTRSSGVGVSRPNTTNSRPTMDICQARINPHLVAR